MNQVELFFAKVQKRVLRHNTFPTTKALAKAVLAYVDYWNAHERKPFRWTFSGYPPEMTQAAA